MKLWYEGFETFGNMSDERRKLIHRNTTLADIDSDILCASFGFQSPYKRSLN